MNQNILNKNKFLSNNNNLKNQNKIIIKYEILPNFLNKELILQIINNKKKVKVSFLKIYIKIV